MHLPRFHNRLPLSLCKKCWPIDMATRSLYFALPLIAWAFMASAQAQRNILLIIADDIGIESLDLYNNDPGASLPPTPTLNRLANSGILFSNAYAYPTCSPTRAAMLTGRFGYRTGVLSPNSSDLAANETTLPEVFSAQALPYALGSFGKWHNGGGETGPNVIGGWPHYAGALEGSVPNYRNWTKTVNGVSTDLSDVYAARDKVSDAITWIDGQGSNTWFMWMAFNLAHTPLHTPPPTMYTTDLTGLDEETTPRPFFEAMIEAMDFQIDRLIAQVDTNETTIIFIGDNGTSDNVIQPPYDINGRAKGSLFEGGTHVPMFITGPDVVNPGRTSDALVHCADIFATVLDLTGGVVPAGTGEDSRSLVPIMNDLAFNPAQDCILVESDDLSGAFSEGRAIRDDIYKLIRTPGRSDRLFHMGNDPLEGTNLVQGVLTPTEQIAFDNLSAKLDAWTNVQEVVYVDVDHVAGPWDGASWATAFQTVQEGIDEAYLSHGEVWVAEGIYTPTSGSGRNASFFMAEKVGLYGGFTGTETARAQADPVARDTVLSGDVGAQGDASDNCYHVVTGARLTALDGFTIRDGRADGPELLQKGGGFYALERVASDISRCIFADNHAVEGGAVYAYNESSANFTDCTFSSNTASRGAGLLLRIASSGTFSNCTFSSNIADWAGGAVYADYGSSPVFIDCTFSNNSTTGKGGALMTDDLASQVGVSSPVFTDCQFTGNSASFRGGAIYNFDGSETTVTGCTFTGNHAGTGGGAIGNDFNSELTVSGNSFKGNTATTGSKNIDSDASSTVN